MPTRLKLTKRLVESIEPPDSGSLYVYDERVPSLAICVTSNGVRTFYRVGRVHGRFKRIKLGRFGEITVEQARQIAADTSLAIRSGKEPAFQIATKGMTLGSLWAWYFTNHCKPRKKTWQSDERRWIAHLKAWEKRTLTSITRSDIAELHGEIKQVIGPYGANHVLEQIRHMLQQAVEHDWLAANPAASIKRFSRTSRKRFLTEDELPRFFAAVDSLRNENARDFFRMALYTGARRGNVLSMRWDEIDMDAATWTVPGDKSKNAEDMIIVLAEPAIEILKRRRNRSQWVFPSHSGTGHYQWPKDAWIRVLERSGLTNLRIHDLRRTLASWQVRAGSSIAVIGSSLGHKSLSATQVYARTQLDQVRQSVSAAVSAMRATEPPPK